MDIGKAGKEEEIGKRMLHDAHKKTKKQLGFNCTNYEMFSNSGFIKTVIIFTN